MTPDTKQSDDSIAVPGMFGKFPGCPGIDEKDAAECAQSDRVLADIAGRLSNVAEGQFDEVLTGCLRTLVEFLGFDRSSVMAFTEYGRRFQVTHSWAVEGVSVAPSDVLLNAQIPWYTQQIRSGHIVNVSSSIDLPSVAAKERGYLLHNGIRSILAIPLLMEGTIIGALSLASLQSQRRWSLGLVSRLRLVAEILALGIRRHQYAQGLKAFAQTVEQVSLGRIAPGKKATEHFRDRALRLMQAEHQERHRMGEVLHEDVMQILAAATMLVQSGDTPPSPASDKGLALLKDALAKLRTLTLELRPDAVSEMTLPDGIRWLIGQMRRRYDLNIDVHIVDTVGPVDDDVRNFLYDSARKLLENVAVHASCKHATLEIRRSDPNYVQLIVSDEGVGFNPAFLQDLPVVAFGLFSIREQAELLGGTLEVDSSPGRGTRVAVSVPVG